MKLKHIKAALVTAADDDISRSIQKFGITRVNGVIQSILNGMKNWDGPLTDKVVKKLLDIKELINEDARKMYAD